MITCVIEHKGDHNALFFFFLTGLYGQFLKRNDKFIRVMHQNNKIPVSFNMFGFQRSHDGDTHLSTVG